MTRSSSRRALAAIARTVAPSGSFTVSKRIPNRGGADTITASARLASTGQTCSARLVFPA